MRRAFAGSDVTDTLASVLRNEPEWQALPPGMPRPLRLVLYRCLEKSPGRRLHDVADARLELEDAIAGYPGLPELGGDASELDAVAGGRRPTPRIGAGSGSAGPTVGLAVGLPPRASGRAGDSAGISWLAFSSSRLTPW